MSLVENDSLIIPDAAVIYCRVSSKRQTSEGTGLDTQEHRCREHAAKLRVPVEAVYYDDVSGGGDFMKRKGMVNLLNYLDQNKDKRYVVIFDDLKRYSRDTEFHLRLRREMQTRNAIRICLNFNFEDSPEGKFLETILAATGTLEREQNARQVSQKMKARVEQGFWVTRAPVGYKYVKSKRGGKELAFDEPLASIAKEALESFACGRFETQAEVKRFLESHPDFPKDLPSGQIRAFTVTRFLRKIVYAGYVESKAWSVSPRQGHHKGLIDLQTHEKILVRMKEGAVAPARKDIHKDFPLRGFVSCGCCSNPMTAAWSKGKTKKYPYYKCQTKTCAEYGKSFPKADVEGRFEDLLKKLTPSQKLTGLVHEALDSILEQRSAQFEAIRTSLQKDLKAVEKTIDDLLDRIVETTNASVITAYESRIAKLEREKLIAVEKLEKTTKPKLKRKEFIELPLLFLSNPWKIWSSGNLTLQKTVLRLLFKEKLQYTRKQGYRTPKTTISFNDLVGICSNKCEMVLQERIELSTSSLPMRCSTTELLQLFLKITFKLNAFCHKVLWGASDNAFGFVA